MTVIEIDTEKRWADVEQQIMELETHELLKIHDMFRKNSTVFTAVEYELTFRHKHKRQIEHTGQLDEIEERFYL
jgi:hypothetical protein